MNLPISLSPTTFITHISASSLNSYLMCPKQFHFRYIAKKKPAFRNVVLPFGSAWGETVQHWLRETAAGTTITDDDLEVVFSQVFDDELNNSDVPVRFGDKGTHDSLRETASRMIAAFTAKVEPPDEVLGIETAFSIELHHPDDPDETLPVPLIGAFDAVVVQKGETAIWELKSAAKKYSQDQFNWMLQPVGYELGARAFGYNDIPVDVIVTTKAKAPDVEIQRLKKSHVDERHFFDLADNVLRAVGAGVFPRSRSWACNGCGYREECDR